MKVSLSNKSATISNLNNCNYLNQRQLHCILGYTSVPLRKQESVQEKKRL